jgi:hypothetical protein
MGRGGFDPSCERTERFDSQPHALRKEVCDAHLIQTLVGVTLTGLLRQGLVELELSR